MTSENFEEMFQLIKDDIRGTLNWDYIAATIGFFSTVELFKSYVYD